jgi:hypothetical protein
MITNFEFVLLISPSKLISHHEHEFKLSTIVNHLALCCHFIIILLGLNGLSILPKPLL